jgi:outer membrane protein OmpA-like peptidoglycan-associated protein
MTPARLSLAAASAAVLLLAACQEPLPGQSTDQARQGALIGAGIGAVAGALTGDDDEERLRNAVIGAAAVGAVGGAIGNSLDRQEAELRQQLGGNVGIVNNGQNLVVTLPEAILFATDSTSVSAASQSSLRTVAASLNRYPNTTVNVIGHTDNVGAAAYNQDLSQRRAQAVASVLVNSGVSPSRIVAIGRGLTQPVASNATAEGRAQNRRVEIVITPTG